MNQYTFPYKRIIVFGSTGAGKSTLIRCISRKIALPVVDMDLLNNQARASEKPVDTFCVLAQNSVAGDSWILDGSYTVVQHITWPRAEALIWLDYSGWIVISRLIKRSLYRIFLRKNSKKNGESNVTSVEKRTQTYLQSILTYSKRRRQYFVTLYSSENKHLHIIRLCSPEDATRWLELFEN